MEAQGKLILPDEDEEREMYHLTRRFLSSMGYERYEISNYARPGFECRHNIGYWRGTDYLGLGLGAASLIDGCRFSNTADMKDYLALETGSSSWYSESERLSRESQMEEFMFFGTSDGPGSFRKRILSKIRRKDYGSLRGGYPKK